MENNENVVNGAYAPVEINPAEAGEIVPVNNDGVYNEISTGQALLGAVAIGAAGYGTGKLIEWVYKKWGIPLFEKLGKKAEKDKAKFAEDKNSAKNAPQET